MPDALVVGGGLAGGLAALRLARGGAKVTLVEKAAAPHDKVCGEFLSGEALGELGAVPIERVRIAAAGEAREARLPFPALSLPRRRLDAALLDAARDAGAELRLGTAVRRVERDGEGWRADLPSGDVARTATLLLASGKHDLRGRPRGPGLHGDLVGLKAYFRLAPAAVRDLEGSVDVVFFPGGYCGFQLVEDGSANACLVVSRERLARLGGDPWAVFAHLRESAPHADALLRAAEPASSKPLAIGRVPYGYVRLGTDGAFHLGDQAAVIPSFCGEGMGLALRSGRLAAESVLEGRAAADFQRGFARLAGPRVKAAALLSRALSSVPVQRTAAGAAALVPSLVTALAAATRTPQSSPSSA